MRSPSHRNAALLATLMLSGSGISSLAQAQTQSPRNPATAQAPKNPDTAPQAAIGRRLGYMSTQDGQSAADIKERASAP